jgi:hypothetical protein
MDKKDLRRRAFTRGQFGEDVRHGLDIFMRILTRDAVSFAGKADRVESGFDNQFHVSPGIAAAVFSNSRRNDPAAGTTSAAEDAGGVCAVKFIQPSFRDSLITVSASMVIRC